MRSLTATIVIPVWNRWDQTEPCLKALRPTLGPSDRVVVVDNGSSDGTAEGLRRYPWVRVVSNPDNLGFARGCNQGAAAALERPANAGVVVFLNNDTVVGHRWLDGLLQPFEEATVGATGPRSNFVSGPQVVGSVGYTAAPSPAFRAFTRGWEREHRGQASETGRLVGFALAVRREAWQAVGGFDEGFGLGGFEDDDLCARLADAGWGLRIAHASFVHHAGHATFEGNGVDWVALQDHNRDRFVANRHRAEGSRPLVSACLIVRDEEELLPACLASLNQVVDEVVVYDTGSVDRTVALAESLGARVVRGYWDDDFARARNESLRHCRGRWILHIDADEVFEGDARSLRGRLEGSGDWDVFTLEIFNEMGDGSDGGITHRGMRIFRRETCHWVGRLHEQVVRRDGDAARFRGAALNGVRLRHSGYRDEVVVARNKIERNLRLARSDYESAEGRGDHDGLLELNLARSLGATGDFEAAVAHYRRAADLFTEGVTLRFVLALGTEAFMALGDLQTAHEWARRLRGASRMTGVADFLEAQILRRLGRPAEAVTLLEHLGAVENEDGYSLPGWAPRTELSAAYLDAGRPEEAASVLSSLIGQHADLPTIGVTVTAFGRAGRPLEELAAILPADRLVRVAAALTLLEPAAADTLAEALLARLGDRPEIHAASIRFAPRLPLGRALEWSARLRDRGMAGMCPLIAVAGDETRSALDRGRYGAAALAAFGDDRAEAWIRDAVDSAAPDEIGQILSDLGALVPDLAAGLAASGAEVAIS